MISNRTWIEISKENLVHNTRELKKVLPEKTLSMAVIKSNAYGHDLVLCGKTLEPEIDYFGVDDVEEAFVLRKNGITKPILVFGYVPESYLKQVVDLEIELTATSLPLVKKFSEHGIKFHLKLETGLGRQGMIDGEFEELCEFFGQAYPLTPFRGKGEQSNQNLERPEVLPLGKDLGWACIGIYSHFASAENNSGQEYSLIQFSDFIKKAEKLETLMEKKLIKHISATSGNLMNSDFALDMVRFGLGLYGLYPSLDVKEKNKDVIKLKPALTWKAVISEIKKLPKGHFIGYDQTHSLERDSIVGIIPIGYWHGIPRTLSNCGYVIVEGARAPILGRVSMDMIIVDLTDAIAGSPLLGGSASAGSEGLGERFVATVIGEGISAEDFAKLAGTINYEVITRINPIIGRHAEVVTRINPFIERREV